MHGAGIRQDVTAKDIAEQVLRKGYLRERQPAEKAPAVIRDICGIQAQFPHSAEEALWARTNGLRRGAIAELVEAKAITKTWAMRGTVHLLERERALVYLKALEEENIKVFDHWMETRGVTSDTTERLCGSVCELLGDDRLTRRELADRLVDIHGEEARPLIEDSWGGILKKACYERRIRFGPNKGRELAFERIPSSEVQGHGCSRDEALALLFIDYLGCYGPATLMDFCQWSGLRRSRIQGVVRSRCLDSVDEQEVSGQQFLALKDDWRRIKESRARADDAIVLPQFDQFLLCHRDKTPFLEADIYKKVYRPGGIVSAVIIANGEVVATWRRSAKPKRLEICIEQLRPIKKRTFAAIDERFAMLGEFYGLAPSMHIERL